MTLTNVYNPFIARPSVASIMRCKRLPAVERRIEEIGRLNDEYLRCIDNRDHLGLLQLAERYAERKYMQNTAAKVRQDAAEMNKVIHR